MKLLKTTATLATIAVLASCSSGTSEQNDEIAAKQPSYHGEQSKDISAPEKFKPNLSIQNGDVGPYDFTKKLTVTVDDGAIDKLTVKATYSDKTSETRPKRLKGSIAENIWTSRGLMEPNATYSVLATVVSEDGATAKLKKKVKTTKLALDKQTFASSNVASGQTYGVGMPIVLRFDVPVKDKKNFEQNFELESTPKQMGAWHWMSDTEVHYRTKKYWKPGTKVELAVNTNSVSAGNGIYGQSTKKFKFKIGDAHVVRIDDRTKLASVFKNGKKIRTIPISQGKPGFITRSGIKVISEKHRKKQMRSESIGISGGSEYYDLIVDYALRLTNSGEFIHAAPWNSHLFGRYNGSHGCTGMALADAQWLYELVRVGDVIDSSHTGRAMEAWNGYGEWNLTWKEWKKGSAL